MRRLWQCCLVKLEDDSSGELHYTDVSGRYYDQGACECSVYSRRSEKVVECLRLSLDDLDNWRWLPSSCAYLRIADGKPYRSGIIWSAGTARGSTTKDIRFVGV